MVSTDCQGKNSDEHITAKERARTPLHSLHEASWRDVVNNEAHMKLEGSQRHELREALVDAFPSRSELEQMVSFHLNKNLGTISDDPSVELAAFRLITWAERNGCLLDLVEGARKQNPGNELLNDFYKKMQFLLVKPEKVSAENGSSPILIGSAVQSHSDPTNSSAKTPEQQPQPDTSQGKTNTVSETSTEKLRAVVHIHIEAMHQAINKVHGVFLGESEVFKDKGEVVFSALKEQAFEMQSVVVELLKLYHPDAQLRYQIEHRKDCLLRAIERIGLLVYQFEPHTSLLHTHWDMKNQLETAGQDVQKIEHLIHAFCDQIEQAKIVVDQSSLLTKNDG